MSCLIEETPAINWLQSLKIMDTLFQTRILNFTVCGEAWAQSLEALQGVWCIEKLGAIWGEGWSPNYSNNGKEGCFLFVSVVAITFILRRKYVWSFEPCMNPEGSRAGRTQYNNSIIPRSWCFPVPVRTDQITTVSCVSISMECYDLRIFNNEFFKWFYSF